MSESRVVAADRERPRAWRRRAWGLAAVLIVGGVLAEAVGLAGLPLPGVLHRYPRGELDAVAARIGSGCHSGPGYEPSVDLVRSRVVANGGLPSGLLTDDERAMVVVPADARVCAS